MSAFDPSGHALADQPFLKDCRTCWTGQSLLASITRTREPSVLSMRAWEQNSSSISETSRTVVGSHPNVRSISPGQIRQLEPSSSFTIWLLSCFSICMAAPPRFLKQKRFVERQGSSVMEPASGTLIYIAPDERPFSIVVVSVWKNGRQRGYLDGPWAA